jgi:hypothetical protein
VACSKVQELKIMQPKILAAYNNIEYLIFNKSGENISNAYMEITHQFEYAVS